MEIVSRHHMYATPQRDTQVFLQTFSASHHAASTLYSLEEQK